MLMDVCWVGVVTFAGWGKFDITLLFFSLSLNSILCSLTFSIFHLSLFHLTFLTFISAPASKSICKHPIHSFRTARCNGVWTKESSDVISQTNHVHTCWEVKSKSPQNIPMNLLDSFPLSFICFLSDLSGVGVNLPIPPIRNKEHHEWILHKMKRHWECWENKWIH